MFRFVTMSHRRDKTILKSKNPFLFFLISFFRREGVKLCYIEEKIQYAIFVAVERDR